MPPVNVVVAGEPNVAAPVVPLKARAATVEVALYVEVARYKALEMERRVHSLEPRASERESCGAEVAAAVSSRLGVVVPIPTLVFWTPPTPSDCPYTVRISCPSSAAE